MFKYIFCLLLITLCFSDSINFIENENIKHKGDNNPSSPSTLPEQPLTFFQRMKSKMFNLKNQFETSIENSRSKFKEYSSKLTNFLKRKLERYSNKPLFTVDMKETNREIVFKIPMEGYSKKDILVSIRSEGTKDYIVISGQTPITSENLLAKTFEFSHPIPIKVLKEISYATFSDGNLIIQITKLIERNEIQLQIQ